MCLEVLVAFNTSKEMIVESLMMALAKLYGEKFALNKVFLKNHVFNMHMLEDGFVVDHVNEYNVVASHLSFVGETFDYIIFSNETTNHIATYHGSHSLYDCSLVLHLLLFPSEICSISLGFFSSRVSITLSLIWFWIFLFLLNMLSWEPSFFHFYSPSLYSQSII